MKCIYSDSLPFSISPTTPLTPSSALHCLRIYEGYYIIAIPGETHVVVGLSGDLDRGQD